MPHSPIRRILVVDDVPEVLGLFRSHLRVDRIQGVELDTESDAHRAIERVRANRYDVIVSDLRLRGRSGLDVLAAARDGAPEARRILMTGYASLELPLDALEGAAPERVIAKPLSAAVIRQLLGDDAPLWPIVASYHPTGHTTDQ